MKNPLEFEKEAVDVAPEELEVAKTLARALGADEFELAVYPDWYKENLRKPLSTPSPPLTCTFISEPWRNVRVDVSKKIAKSLPAPRSALTLQQEQQRRGREDREQAAEHRRA